MITDQIEHHAQERIYPQIKSVFPQLERMIKKWWFSHFGRGFVMLSIWSYC